MQKEKQPRIFRQQMGMYFYAGGLANTAHADLIFSGTP
jgi:hypothetical protein